MLIALNGSPVSTPRARPAPAGARTPRRPQRRRRAPRAGRRRRRGDGRARRRPVRRRGAGRHRARRPRRRPPPRTGPAAPSCCPTAPWLSHVCCSSPAWRRCSAPHAAARWPEAPQRAGYPAVRSPHDGSAAAHQGPPWVIRTYAGHSSPEASNALYRATWRRARRACPSPSTCRRRPATTPTASSRAVRSARSASRSSTSATCAGSSPDIPLAR